VCSLPTAEESIMISIANKHLCLEAFSAIINTKKDLIKATYLFYYRMSFLLSLSKDNTELLDKLPEEIRTMIMAYTNGLDEKISLLLISDEDFENRYMQTIMDFVYCMAQIGHFIADRKDAQNIMKQLNEIFPSALSKIENKFKEKPFDNAGVSTAVVNAIEIISNYSDITINQAIAYKPEYFPAFEAYINLSICLAALDKIVKNTDNDIYQKNSTKLIRRCQHYTKKLESYVETIEIESDPEQRVILERVKGTSTQ
jgi:hypothetical protein